MIRTMTSTIAGPILIAAALFGGLMFATGDASAAGCRGRGPGCTTEEVPTINTVKYSAFPNGNVVVNNTPRHQAANSCQLFSEPPVNIVGTHWTTVAWGNQSQGCLPRVIN